MASSATGKHAQWLFQFVDRIYQLCNIAHPGMAIEREAVFHIRQLVGRIILEILDAKPINIAELEKIVSNLLPQQAPGIIKEASDFINSWSPRKLHVSRTNNGKTLYGLLQKLIALIKEHLGCKEKERKEREKEIERMAIFLLSMSDYITEDILKWTGNYVKNIRNAQMTISLQNLQIALNADKNLMELTEVLHNEDEDGTSTGGFLFDISLEEDLPDERVEISYDKIARDFLHEEGQYVRNLNLLVNVFKRRFDTAMHGEQYLEDIFGNINELHELSLQVERTLEDSIEMSDAPCVGMGLWELAEAHEFNCYVEYMENVTNRMPGAVEKLLREPKYQQFFNSEEKVYSSSADGQTFRLAVRYVFPTLLQAPILHFYRYVEYVNRLLRLCQIEEDRMDLKNVQGYLASLTNRLDAMLTSNIRRMIKQEQTTRALTESPIYQLEKLQEVQRKIDGYVGKNIGQTCSELVREGDLSMVRPSLSLQPLETLRRNRWQTDRRVFLFDQLIVMCKVHKNVLKFKDRLNIRRTEMVDLEDTDDLKHAFRIESTERSSSLIQVFTFVCKSREDKEQWMSSLVMLQTRSILDRLLDAFVKDEKKRIPLVTPGPDQYRFAEPDTDENITFEDYTSSSGIPVVKHGTVVKLVERLTFHLYTDNNYVKTFLISFRSFCTPNELLQMLIERFEVPYPAKLQPQSVEMRGGPLAGRYDTVQSHGLSGQLLLFNQPPAYSEQSLQRFRKEYERPIQRRVLAVMHQWVKYHWYDFEADPALLQATEEFLRRSCDTPGRLTNQHRKFAKSILSLLEKKRAAGPSTPSTANVCAMEGHANGAFESDEPGLSLNGNVDPQVNSFQPKKPEIIWHVARKGDVASYDLLTLHPLEIGRQLTLLHFDLYRAIKPIELVGAAWMKSDKHRKSPQLLKLTNHSNQLTYWVSRSIVDTDSLEERVAMFSRVLEVMSVFEELHNFTGLVAFYSALNSTCVHRLTWCWDRLDNEKQKCYARFQNLCNPHWNAMIRRLQSVDTPCVPFFGHYLTSIVFFEGGNSTFVKHDVKNDVSDPSCDPTSPPAYQRKVLVSFFKCRRIASVISEIQMYQNQPYALAVEPSIRQFFESINPQADFDGDEDSLQAYLYDQSLKIQPKDVDRLPEVKPKRPPIVLKSPGIKPPKQSNHYSSSNNHGTLTQPPTPAPIEVARNPSTTSILQSPTEEAPFGIVDIHPGQQPRYIGDATRRGNAMSIGPLAPPPLHPRRNRPGPSAGSPSLRSPIAPSLHSRRPTVSPQSGSASPRSAVQPQAFVFPDMSSQGSSMSPPQLPPRTVASTSQNSADVTVSVSLPPILPPKRTATVMPPPRPPKPSRLSNSPPSGSAPSRSSPNESPSVSSTRAASPSGSPPSAPVSQLDTVPSSSPPPLPPKTYKSRKQSSSPTN